MHQRRENCLATKQNCPPKFKSYFLAIHLQDSLLAFNFSPLFSFVVDDPEQPDKFSKYLP